MSLALIASGHLPTNLMERKFPSTSLPSPPSFLQSEKYMVLTRMYGEGKLRGNSRQVDV